MANTSTVQEATPSQPTSQRDARGRFVAGNQGGPGNPFARQTARLRKAMLAAVTDADIQAIVAKLIELAKGGDVAASKLVLAYAIGKPDEAVDPDTVDVHEFQLYQQATADAGAMGQVMECLPVETACAIVRAVRPILAEAKRKDLLERFLQSDEDEEEEEEEFSNADDPEGSDEEALLQQTSEWAGRQEPLNRRPMPRPSPDGANGRAARRHRARTRKSPQRAPAPSANGQNGPTQA
jgi:hypothetical protein